MRYRTVLAAALLASPAGCSSSPSAPSTPAPNPSSARAAAITLSVACEHLAVWALILDGGPVALHTTLAAGTITLPAASGPHVLRWVELDPSSAAARSYGQASAYVGRTGPTIPIACARAAR